jgi:RNA polymerase sigma factor (sigma-70 family)
MGGYLMQTLNRPEAIDGKDDSRSASTLKHHHDAKIRRNYFAGAGISDVLQYPRHESLDYLKEAKLIKRAQAGDLNARNVVWAANVRLAYSVVNRFHIPKDLLPDAIQEGVLMLHRAIAKFDVERYNAFSTYAWHWVRQGVQRFLRRQRFGYRIPDHLFGDFVCFRRAVMSRHSQAERNLYLENNDDFHPKQIRRLTSLSAIVDRESLDELDSDTKETIAERPPAAKDDYKKLVGQMLATLNQRDRLVLCHRYGLAGLPELTLESLGKKLNLTRERIRQIQGRAEERLRVKFRHLGHLVATPVSEGDEPEADRSSDFAEVQSASATDRLRNVPLPRTGIETVAGRSDQNDAQSNPSLISSCSREAPTRSIPVTEHPLPCSTSEKPPTVPSNGGEMAKSNDRNLEEPKKVAATPEVGRERAVETRPSRPEGLQETPREFKHSSEVVDPQETREPGEGSAVIDCRERRNRVSSPPADCQSAGHILRNLPNESAALKCPKCHSKNVKKTRGLHGLEVIIAMILFIPFVIPGILFYAYVESLPCCSDCGSRLWKRR